MSISSAKGMLARLKHLERSRGATDEMRGWVMTCSALPLLTVACAPLMALWCGIAC